jgi:uncharacterized protein YcbK (DUF882 family)
MKSDYFNRKEFACKCGCGFATVDVELLEVLEEARAFFNQPIIINSACRCISHNHEIGGRPKSKHTQGIACDIVVKNVEPNVVQRYFLGKYSSRYGIGSYKTFTHIDIRADKARWVG